MLQRLLTALMIPLLMIALGAIVMPFVLMALTHPFPGRLVFTGIFAAVALEKTYAMFFRMRDKASQRAAKDWTVVTVALSYAISFYAVLLEFYFRGTGIRFPLACGLGFAVYGLAVASRYWAFQHLGRQWEVHVDAALENEQRLVVSGPYRFVRHPLYTSAIFEIIGLALVANAFFALLPIMLLFVPCEVHRAHFEEKYLRQVFAADYEQYAKQTPPFLPQLRRLFGA